MKQKLKTILPEKLGVIPRNKFSNFPQKLYVSNKVASSTLIDCKLQNLLLLLPPKKSRLYSLMLVEFLKSQIDTKVISDTLIPLTNYRGFIARKPQTSSIPRF